uniref:Secreted protein n=1 Tax=uncultured bacterium A1Q1_fos_568 TaxID=1256586 RepID=L7VUR0_9BACT|nr:hypothetical protein [uncultured bacterium A1Q1_fos_568]
MVRDNKAIAAAVALLVCAVVAVAAGKVLAEGAADRAVENRVAEIDSLLGDTEPQDLMAFGASVGTDGSLAQRVRDTDGFVNVKAGADLAFVRFQPSGWWSGFTERCIVVLVRNDGVTIETPSRSCNRVQVPAG